MAINWYSHHIGDYAKKTQHLTILEHGCYRLLLDLFYSQGGAFKDDRQKIYRTIRANNGAERRAVDRCLFEFFELSADGLWNQTRAAEEISKYNNIKEIRKNIGAIGGAKAVANRVAKKYPPTPTPTPTKESKEESYPPEINSESVSVSGAAKKSLAPPPAPIPSFSGENSESIPHSAKVKLADDFGITQEMGEFALRLGWSESDAVKEGQKFSFYWVFGKGKGGRKTLRGWSTAWANWLEIAAKGAK